MKRLTLALAFTALSAIAAFAGDVPGFKTEDVFAPHHGRNMSMAIWYPGSGGSRTLIADNAVFNGGDVLQNAIPLPGKHPVVLLSHGMGGTYRSLNWLASGLAEKGAIVISVDHPNGTFADKDLQKMFNHWTRVQDLETALDHVLVEKDFNGAIDPDHIYAAGFSFGGWTALSIGGATANPEGNMAYCKAAGERSHNCTDLATFGVDPAKMDKARWTASYKDPRVKAVAAIDPGLTWKMTPENVTQLDQSKLLLIGLGSGTDRLVATDTTAKGSNFEALVPRAKVEVLAPAVHFTGMPLCKPKGEAILAEEKDDPVCTDPAGTNRQDVHARIIDLVSQHFGF